MQNFNSNSCNSSLFSSTNYFNELTSNLNKHVDANNNNRLLNMRRSSLGNINTYDESAFVQFNTNNMSQLMRPSIPMSPVYPMDSNLQNSNQDFGSLSDDIFNEGDYNSFNRFNFNSELASSPNLATSNYNNNNCSSDLSNSFVLSQLLQQQQRNQQQQEGLLTFSKNSPPTQSNESNFMFSSPLSLTNRSTFAPVSSTPPSKVNLRRRSYHFGQINSLLQPVQESRPISPMNSQHFSYQQQQREVEKRINMLINSTQNNNQSHTILNSSLMADQQANNFLSLNQQPSINNQIKQRMRAFSIGGGSLGNSTTSSFLSDFNQINADSSNLSLQSKSLSNLNITANTPFASFRKLESFEEKLATTGNIFQKRDDWSIIDKLPLNKQNTIHMRLEDEGPFGNDEIRCFVLSHFSSLGVKELSCVFCDCSLIIYDRFPLIDGTLFLSPYNYDPKKAISTQLPHKTHFLQQNLFNQSPQLQQQSYKQADLLQQKEREQYIYAICLKCMMQEKDHDIKCKNCKKSWQENGGTSLQIGTLYKYDIFAAFPCCQQRLNCSNCSHPIINFDSGSLQYFSSYTEEKECGFCNTKAFHFIKPLNDIFFESRCHDEEKSDQRPIMQNDLGINENYDKSHDLSIENEE